MQKKSTILKVDIAGFHSIAQSKSPGETAHYLLDYYDFVFNLASEFNWRIVKTIGDCVLLSAEENASQERMEGFCEKLQSKFDVNVHYRMCIFEEIEYHYNDYSCRDVIGQDINFLFLEDSSTLAAR